MQKLNCATAPQPEGIPSLKALSFAPKCPIAVGGPAPKMHAHKETDANAEERKVKECCRTDTVVPIGEQFQSSCPKCSF